MARRYISELQPGEHLDDQVFLIASKDLRTTTQGNLYIHAVLVDRTGQVPARLWQATEDIFSNLPEGGFARFKGRAENYKGTLQFIIEAIRPVEEHDLDLSEFLPQTDQDIDQMWARCTEILETIQQPDLRRLVDAFLKDPELMRRFRTAPAAITLHHSYLGGLLEHTLNLLEMALLVIPRYPELSVDLVLAGILLHDIGKTAELTYRTSFAYTDEGHLLGHLMLATLWVDQKCATIEEETGQPFPEQLKWVLQHIILSHHGKYEFGSPKLPALPEAIAIHHLDNLDAKVKMYLTEIEKDRDPQSSWSKFNRVLETKVYKLDVTGNRPPEKTKA
ncbi:MAG: HD domain-containing protein [bacterium]|nr:HD domain-containing protein [bacterium]